MSLWPTLIGGGISLLSSIFAKKPKLDIVTNKDLAGEYSDFRANLDRQNNLSEQLIDPNSAFNIGRGRQLEKSAYNQQAFGNILNQRNFAQGGMGGFSGIQSQQQQAGMDKTQQQNQDRIQEMIANNFNLGFKGIQGVGKGYQQYGDIMGQNLLNQTAWNNQMETAGVQAQNQGLYGLGQGLMHYGLQNPTG